MHAITCIFDYELYVIYNKVQEVRTSQLWYKRQMRKKLATYEVINYWQNITVVQATAVKE